MDRKINAQLELDSKARGSYRYQLFNNRYLSVRNTRGKYCQEYIIDLVSLNTESTEYKSLSWHWLIAASISAVVGAVLLFDLTEPTAAAQTGIMAGSVMVASAVILLRMFYKSMFYTTQYHSLFSNVPLLGIYQHVSSTAEEKQHVANFIGQLDKTIRDNKRQLKFKPEAQKAGEIRMLRRLVEQGVLSQANYEAGKSTILGSPLRAA